MMPKLTLTSGWASFLVVLLCLFTSVVGNWFLFGWRLNEQGARIKSCETFLVSHNNAIIRQDEKLDNILNSLARIEGSLDTYVTKELCEARCGSN